MVKKKIKKHVDVYVKNVKIVKNVKFVIIVIVKNVEIVKIVKIVNNVKKNETIIINNFIIIIYIIL
jgi:hypothetical protein